MKPMTAIEQVIYDLKQLRDKSNETLVKVCYNVAISVAEDHKRIEKEQIKAAHKNANTLAGSDEWKDNESEEYYEDTFIETPLGEETTAPQQ